MIAIIVSLAAVISIVGVVVVRLECYGRRQWRSVTAVHYTMTHMGKGEGEEREGRCACSKASWVGIFDKFVRMWEVKY